MEPEFNLFLFQLGKVQFFTKLTVKEVTSGVEYKEIYWAHMESKQVHGPFPTIYDAMTHFTRVIAAEKAGTPIPNEPPTAPVIYVDFSTKKRIIHE